jgi:hypothetical protein
MEKWEEDSIDHGNFFMCYKHWCEIFYTMYICRNFFHDNEYRAVRFSQSFTEDNNGGTPNKPTPEACEEWGKNPFVRISVGEASVTLYICTLQEDPRIKDLNKAFVLKELPSMCFSILQCEGVLNTTVPM